MCCVWARCSCDWRWTIPGPEPGMRPPCVGVILAGGRGERMQAGRNKALLELGGRPLIMYAVETLSRICDSLLVVCAQADLPAMGHLLPAVPLIVGGATRHGSEW